METRTAFGDSNPQSLFSSFRKRNRQDDPINPHSTSPQSTPNSSRSNSPSLDGEYQSSSQSNLFSSSGQPPPRKRRNRNHSTLSNSDVDRLAGISIQSSNESPASNNLPLESRTERFILDETRAPPSSPVNSSRSRMSSQDNVQSESNSAFSSLDAALSGMIQNSNSNPIYHLQRKNAESTGGNRHPRTSANSDVDMKTRRPPSTYEIDDHRILITSLSDSESEGEKEEIEGAGEELGEESSSSSSQKSLPTSTDNILINSELITKLEAEAKKRTLLGISAGTGLESSNDDISGASSSKLTRSKNRGYNGGRRTPSGSGYSSRSSSGSVTPRDVEMSGGDTSTSSNPAASALVLWKKPEDILNLNQASSNPNPQTIPNSSGYQSDLEDLHQGPSSLYSNGNERMENGNENSSKFNLESQIRRTFSPLSQEAEFHRNRSNPFSTRPDLHTNANPSHSLNQQPSMTSNDFFNDSNSNKSPFAFGQVTMPGQQSDGTQMKVQSFNAADRESSAWSSWSGGAAGDGEGDGYGNGNGNGLGDGDAMELD